MSESRDQSRIQALDPDRQPARSGDSSGSHGAKFALVPNLFRVLANAPVALEGLMGLGTALARGALNEKAGSS